MDSVASVAIVAPGNMGAAVARRLGEHGVRVVTALEGRGAASVARAREAGMTAVPGDRLCEAQFVLSILPPAAAVSFAQTMAPLLRRAAQKPVFVDCNAVSPDTVRQIGDVIAATGAPFIDAAIIGLPPQHGGGPSPHFYSSGPDGNRLLALAPCGLDVRVLDGPVGAAAALKMCYAGINKGLAAIASAMILAAERSGATAALYQEMSESLPGLLSSLRRQVPDMLPKAYRWVAEMREIAAFGGADDEATREIFNGFSRLFEQIAQDVGGEQRASSSLKHFFT
jgi:3-hydroxyisobutyrate dehydrogenase-like beta-hydroxyacid dehydrogenase